MQPGGVGVRVGVDALPGGVSPGRRPHLYNTVTSQVMRIAVTGLIKLRKLISALPLCILQVNN